MLGPNSSFQQKRPAAPGSVLELAGGCPQICPGFGWPGPHRRRRSPRSGTLRDSCAGPAVLRLSRGFVRLILHGVSSARRDMASGV